MPNKLRPSSRANRSLSESFDEKEAQARFEAALKGALSTPHKPLKEKPKVKKAAKPKKRVRQMSDRETHALNASGPQIHSAPSSEVLKVATEFWEFVSRGESHSERQRTEQSS